MPLVLRKPKFLSSVRFRTRKAAIESGTFEAFQAKGLRPIIVKGKKGISSEEREMRKQFPEAFRDKHDPFVFRIVKLGKKKKVGFISKIFKKKRRKTKKRKTRRRKR